MQAQADGVAYELVGGDTLCVTGGVRHRRRSLHAETRVLVVGVADDVDPTTYGR